MNFIQKILLILLTFLIAISCKDVNAEPVGNTFYFENPQPINDSELNVFPNIFLGRYMDLDSMFLNIQQNLIFTEFTSKHKIPNKDLDSLKLYYIINPTTIISKSSNLKFHYRQLKDSLEIRDSQIDTLFQFSEYQKAKRISGNLVLNQKDSIFWKVNLLKFEKNRVIFKQLHSDTDLIKMDSITKLQSKMIDSSYYIIAPSRKEFKKFFEIKDFGYNQEFKEVN